MVDWKKWKTLNLAGSIRPYIFRQLPQTQHQHKLFINLDKIIKRFESGRPGSKHERAPAESDASTLFMKRGGSAIFPASAEMNLLFYFSHCAGGSVSGRHSRSPRMSHRSSSCVMDLWKCGTARWWIWAHTSDSSSRLHKLFITGAADLPRRRRPPPPLPRSLPPVVLIQLSASKKNSIPA